MKKTLLASLGLTLMLSTSASVALAEEANTTKDLTPASVLEYHEQEPNDSFEQANYYFIGDAVIGRLGTEGVPGVWEAYDVYKIKAFESQKVHFTIQGDRYSDSWLQMTVYDSTGHKIKRSRDGQYFLDVELEKGKEYYLAVEVPGLQFGGRIFDYKISSEL
ncbi:hypothetical protein UY286_08250 [Paenibacillus polymyxa]|uniref:hypothetical protein n=1 Tax=Paenibacillus TaxID=44249 RepID=UPI0020B692EA|nr:MULTISPECIES: hypothetical protein [Paenibacillus]MCP3805786.1 hypothetical protein [Paenibacillus sp. Lou8.1]MDY7990757.1 hypothetical protein [Paenibacillus polymyxa]MDY8117431.1 hypothetical protein [Paenibacillus polymyxa]